MASSLDLDKVIAYQAYVQEFAPELIKIAMQGFATAANLSEETDVQGKRTFTIRKSLKRVLKPFTGSYSADADQFDHIPRHLIMSTATAEANVVPSDIRGTYLGGAALPSQETVPAFVTEWIGDFLLRMQVDIEELIWEGDTGESGILGTFNGFSKQIAVAIAASELTEVATGTVTAADVKDQFMSVYRKVSAANRKLGGMKLYTSLANIELYADKYQSDILKFTNPNEVKLTLFGTDCTLVDVPSWEGTDKILVAPQSAMKYGYNNAGRIKTIEQHYHIENSAPVEIGALITTPFDGEIAVNDGF